MANFIGGTGPDVFNGTAGNDLMIGNAGSDTLRGMAGNDRIQGGRDGDILDGGVGIDTLIYTRSDAGVNVNIGTNVTTLSGGHAAGDSISGFENLIGSDYNDVLTGGATRNVLIGGRGHDDLFGMDGRDLLIGGLGADLLNGGNGFDTVSYHQSARGVSVNTLSGQVLGGAAGDTFVSIEALWGSSFGDSLIMDGGDNVIRGRGGDDFIDGGAGDDRLTGGVGADFLHGSTGNDTAGYRNSDAGIIVSLAGGLGQGGHAEGDVFSWIENIDGSMHDDEITGNLLVNVLRGLDGDDILTGAAGADILRGGAGEDAFAFVDLDHHIARDQTVDVALSAPVGSDADKIRDFEQGTDVLQFESTEFSGGIFNTDDIDDLGLTTVGDSAFAFADGNLFHVTYRGVNAFAAEFVDVRHIAHLKDITSLNATDFDFV
ncbi:MAG: hypothetical protein GJ676_16375 [Rhodobacteraceae bacterium]|nr:hypothetical protein [Paracoccaceae bacterium]